MIPPVYYPLFFSVGLLLLILLIVLTNIYCKFCKYGSNKGKYNLNNLNSLRNNGAYGMIPPNTVVPTPSLPLQPIYEGQAIQQNYNNPPFARSDLPPQDSKKRAPVGGYMPMQNMLPGTNIPYQTQGAKNEPQQVSEMKLLNQKENIEPIPKIPPRQTNPTLTINDNRSNYSPKVANTIGTVSTLMSQLTKRKDSLEEENGYEEIETGLLNPKMAKLPPIGAAGLNPANSQGSVVTGRHSYTKTYYTARDPKADKLPTPLPEKSSGTLPKTSAQNSDIKMFQKPASASMSSRMAPITFARPPTTGGNSQQSMGPVKPQIQRPLPNPDLKSSNDQNISANSLLKSAEVENNTANGVRRRSPKANSPPKKKKFSIPLPPTPSENPKL